MIPELLSEIHGSVAGKPRICAAGGGKAAALSSIIRGKRTVLITTSSEEALWLRQEVSLFSPDIPSDIFPAPDALTEDEKVSPEITGKRLEVLFRLKKLKEYLAIVPLRAALHRTDADPPLPIVISKGGKLSLERVSGLLSGMGYKRMPVVGEKGEFSVRGGIIDIFPVNLGSPVRGELLGDEVESLRSFDPVSQRSKGAIARAEIFANEEKRETEFLRALPGGIQLVIDEAEILPDFRKISADVRTFSPVVISSLLEPGEEQLFSQPESYVKEAESISPREKLVIVSQHSSRFPGLPSVTGQIRSGFKFREWEILSDRELFGIEGQRPKTKGRGNVGVGEEIRADLKDGDFIVHEDYGVGIYRGLHRIEEGEHILIEFAHGDKLYVPPNSMGKVEKYVSEEGAVPRLSRMGGGGWERAKAKVKKSVKDLTKELIALYAERNKAKKMPYPEEDAWQKELEDSFPYEETPDQLKAIEAVSRDMGSEKPMDRLICGDVGYGKTEVALRAIVRAASGGRQVAVLVPTTILADQHYHYFKERLSALPFRIEMLSRFKEKKEQKEIVERLKTGEIDIVVGTHRLLSRDVSFKDLGLLVVDEEHRFGVGHKERMKKLKRNIDVLSMTATPIPRTLYMALSGARDMSVIQTAPADRSPVKTYITAFNETIVREAILREADRGGQIFFVHNRIESIERSEQMLRRLVPDEEVAVAHGRMKEEELERVMEGFLQKRYRTLLCTAIIESGLDITNANTIVIDRADRMGLAQLYQLRGRVGRSPVRAYAYLMYDREELASETALSRLKAIQEFATLGSGYKLALRDLEIRGAGNLLGAEQHGHMLAVGFDLYCELLEEAVHEIKGIKEPTPRQTMVDIREEAFIPERYIEDEQQRIALYRRLNLVSDERELKEMWEELSDRFGKPPGEAVKLFNLVALKVKAQKAGIRSIREDGAVYVEWMDGRGKRFKLQTKDRLKEIRDRIGL